MNPIDPKLFRNIMKDCFIKYCYNEKLYNHLSFKFRPIRIQIESNVESVIKHSVFLQILKENKK